MNHCHLTQNMLLLNLANSGKENTVKFPGSNALNVQLMYVTFWQ